MTPLKKLQQYINHEAKEKEFQEKFSSQQTICMRKGEHLTLENLRKLVDAGIIEPSYYRLPCACSLVYEEQMEFSFDS